MPTMNKKIFFTSVLLASLIFSAALAVFSARARSVVVDRVPESSSASAMQTPRTFRQHLHIWIHGDDVRPKVIHAWPGLALIKTENAAGEDATLAIEQVIPGQANVPIGRVPTPARTRRGAQEIPLAVGEYVFFELARPRIRGRILVEPRGSN